MRKLPARPDRRHGESRGRAAVNMSLVAVPSVLSSSCRPSWSSVHSVSTRNPHRLCPNANHAGMLRRLEVYRPPPWPSCRVATARAPPVPFHSSARQSCSLALHANFRITRSSLERQLASPYTTRLDSTPVTALMARRIVLHVAGQWSRPKCFAEPAGW